MIFGSFDTFSASSLAATSMSLAMMASSKKRRSSVEREVVGGLVGEGRVSGAALGATACAGTNADGCAWACTNAAAAATHTAAQPTCNPGCRDASICFGFMVDAPCGETRERTKYGPPYLRKKH